MEPSRGMLRRARPAGRIERPAGRLFPADAKYDSCTKPEVVLPVVVAVGELGEEVLSVKGTNRGHAMFTTFTCPGCRP